LFQENLASASFKYLEAEHRKRDEDLPVANLILYLVAVVAVVAMWRGLWQLMDIYLWPKNPKRSNWASFIIGFVLVVIVLYLINP